MKLGNYQDNTIDAFGDTYEFLMGMYASNTGKSVGEYYSPAGGLRIAGPHRHRTDTASIIGHLHYLGVPVPPILKWLVFGDREQLKRKAREASGRERH